MHYVVGVDEVGRGSLAGPVTVCAIAWPKNLIFKNEPPHKLNDSKKLSPEKREVWTKYLKSHPRTIIAISHIQPSRIDKINIRNATNLAAERALLKLLTQIKKPQIYLDGGLSVKKVAHLKPETVIKGDAKIPAIMAASIVAKVARDSFLKRLAQKYPDYELEVNKGYGTLRHCQRLRKYGPSRVHRLTFIKNIAIV